MGEEIQFLRGRATADNSSADAPLYPRGLHSVSRRWFPVVVLLMGIGLTLLASYFAARSIQLRTRARFETSAMRACATIRARFEIYDALLHGTSGFIGVEGDITRDRFKSYITRLGISEHYPGVQEIGFARQVPAPEKSNLVASMIKQGEDHFHIWPETEHAESFPITYIEPQSPRNEIAVGYDMFSEPTRRAAMERARDTGDTAASGRVTLIQESESSRQAGFLIYFPVYQGGTVPDTIAERRAKLAGFTFCAFRAGDLFASIFGSEPLEVGLEIFDGTELDPEHLLFRSEKEPIGAWPFRRTIKEIVALDVSGRTWTTRFIAQPETEGIWIPLALLFGGVFLSVAMFYLTRAELKTRREAERAAAQLKVSELALRESEDRLRRYATELEHRVAERTANLAQSIESLEGVLYHVAHDLRAPLRGMASFTTILLDEYGTQLDERGHDYAHRISVAAQRMDRLVQDLLAYGRLAHTPVSVSNLSLDAELNAALNHFSEEIEARDATVEVTRPLPPVKANTALLNQILSNLLSNALKFVRTETRPHLRIYAEEITSQIESSAAKPSGVPRPGKFIRLWIEDNGIGISAEYHERIFRMFERLHGAGAYPGTGIGLAIVRKGAERMGGRVGVESAVGTGSRFWLELPAA